MLKAIYHLHSHATGLCPESPIYIFVNTCSCLALSVMLAAPKLLPGEEGQLGEKCSDLPLFPAGPTQLILH